MSKVGPEQVTEATRHRATCSDVVTALEAWRGPATHSRIPKNHAYSRPDSGPSEAESGAALAWRHAMAAESKSPASEPKRGLRTLSRPAIPAGRQILVILDAHLGRKLFV